MDIKEFYPSIKEETLKNAISFAKQHVQIKTEELRIIMHSRKSLLYDEDIPWIKKNGEGSFDVTMGCYDGAEICEFIGIFILSSLGIELGKSQIGLYRDDGLAVVKNLSNQQIDRTRKTIIKIFKDIGFDIEIQTNLKEVDFLDITFNLTSGTYKPFKKPNDKLMYINTSSNHPPNIIKQLPTSISKRLSDNSSNEIIFNEAKEEYEVALKESGYNESLKFAPNQKGKRNRQRNIIWFNPPFSKNVETNIAKKFLKLVDKHFPRENNPYEYDFHKIFNRNTVKVSYSTTENMVQIINKHNKKITSNNTSTVSQTCNCRNKDKCPLGGINCRKSNVVYKGTLSTSINPNKIYIGITEGPWKARHAVHKTSFTNRNYPTRTSMTDYVWKMKDEIGEMPKITWTIEKTAQAYNNISKKCNLCLQEKIEIIEYPDQKNLLNKRSELINKCRHENKFLLKNYKNKKKGKSRK